LFCQRHRQSGIDTPLNTTLVLAIFSCFTNFHKVAAFFTDSRTPAVRYRVT